MHAHADARRADRRRDVDVRSLAIDGGDDEPVDEPDHFVADGARLRAVAFGLGGRFVRERVRVDGWSCLLDRPRRRGGVEAEAHDGLREVVSRDGDDFQLDGG